MLLRPALYRYGARPFAAWGRRVLDYHGRRAPPCRNVSELTDLLGRSERSNGTLLQVHTKNDRTVELDAAMNCSENGHPVDRHFSDSFRLGFIGFHLQKVALERILPSELLREITGQRRGLRQ